MAGDLTRVGLPGLGGISHGAGLPELPADISIWSADEWVLYAFQGETNIGGIVCAGDYYQAYAIAGDYYQAGAVAGDYYQAGAVAGDYFPKCND